MAVAAPNHNRSTAAATRSPSAATDVAAEQLRAELEGLVRIAARRPNLVVRTGAPNCSWSLDWLDDIVTVNPTHLVALAPDLCRGLALHEAAHAAVTVLHRILAEAHLTRIHPLLNTLEDIRIETWMRARFPGATGWIRAYNDVFYGIMRDQPLPKSRQVQFLGGILELWWFGATTPGTLPEVLAALDACREPIAAATSCQPPLDDDPAGIMASQKAMWEIVRDRILPTWERLVAMDAREGIGRLASGELREFADRMGSGYHSRARGAARLRPARATSPRARKFREISEEAARRFARQPHDERVTDASPNASQRGDGRRDAGGAPSPDGTDNYLTAWRRICRVADRLGDELLRVLVPRQRLRWSAGHPWGPRLDLRRAMQFEADPAQYRSLWCRPILPQRREPAVLLLVDRSSSMTEQGRIDRAFEGMVLLTEVCRRIGVAAAVWSFADDVRQELDWDAAVDGPARRRLGMLPDACQGNTDMAAALDAVGGAFAARRGEPKLLFVIGDGEPNRHEPTLAAVQRLEAAGVATVGLGLGNGTAPLARYFQRSVTEIPPERLVDYVADLLGKALTT
ncbi:MAG: VWA domain-containing protein [Planctomycetes bacterium]|nr:VWA domain-containing protein [Planctomycetota bacterium]